MSFVDELRSLDTSDPGRWPLPIRAGSATIGDRPGLGVELDDAKVARYRLQGASYAVALEQATGETVVECVFVFLGSTEARERSVSDLRAAMREVRAALGASSAAATTPALPRSDP